MEPGSARGRVRSRAPLAESRADESVLRGRRGPRETAAPAKSRLTAVVSLLSAALGGDCVLAFYYIFENRESNVIPTPASNNS